MNASSFHHHFISLISMMQLQFQKQLRLEARRLILSDAINVAEAVIGSVIESASQFSGEYSRTFARIPSRTRGLAGASALGNCSPDRSSWRIRMQSSGIVSRLQIKVRATIAIAMARPSIDARAEFVSVPDHLECIVSAPCLFA